MRSVKDLVKEARKLMEGSTHEDRERAHKLRYDLYVGKYRKHIVERLKRLCPETWEDFSPIWINVYRKVIDRRAGGLYATAPARRYYYADGTEVAEEEKIRIESALSPDYFSGVMDKVARYLESHRTLAVAAVYRHGSTELDVITPAGFDVITGYPDPTRLSDADAFIHERPGGCVVWTQAPDTLSNANPSFIELNEKWEVTNVGENPYLSGNAWIVPFALLQYEDPDAHLFLEGGEELVEAALHVAFTLTDNAFIERYQSFGQPVFQGVPDNVAKTLTLSPNVGIGLGDGQTLDFKAPPGNATDRVAGLQSFLTILANAYDLPPDVLTPSYNPESGIAKRLSSAPLSTYRERYAKRLALAEQSVFEVWKVVHNTHSAEVDRIDPGVYLQTTHAPAQPFFDASEQDSRIQARLTLGLDSVVDVLAREQGVDRATAEQILARNRADNGAAASATPSPVPPAPGPIASLRERMAQRAAAMPPGGNTP